ncbi:MAG: ComF family protein [Nocardioidaceae bacterium]
MWATQWYDAARDLFLGGRCVGCDRPGRTLCPGCRSTLPRSASPAWPTPTPPGLAPPVAAGAYDGVLKAMINAHKERGELGLTAPLGELLAVAVRELVEPRHPGRPAPTVSLVPIPSRAAVVRGRGHDPLLRMTRHAAVRLRRSGVAAHVDRLLVPVGTVRDQAGLSSTERAVNLKGSLAARRPTLSTPTCAVLVDDVLTTGSTAREGQRALESAGISVFGIAAVAATRRLRRVDSADRLPLSGGCG